MHGLIFLEMKDNHISVDTLKQVHQSTNICHGLTMGQTKLILNITVVDTFILCYNMNTYTFPLQSLSFDSLRLFIVSTDRQLSKTM